MGESEGLAPRKILERETGIEPATNSLEGCDSTTELLPPTRLADCAHSTLRRARPLFALVTRPPARLPLSLVCSAFSNRWPVHRTSPNVEASEGGIGEGRTRTFEAARATDLQSAAFDRFATSPTGCCGMRCSARTRGGKISLMELAKGFEPPTG